MASVSFVYSRFVRFLQSLQQRVRIVRPFSLIVSSRLVLSPVLSSVPLGLCLLSGSFASFSSNLIHIASTATAPLLARCILQALCYSSLPVHIPYLGWRVWTFVEIMTSACRRTSRIGGFVKDMAFLPVKRAVEIIEVMLYSNSSNGDS